MYSSFYKMYPNSNDPLHINDIEIARESNGFWERGDLVFSARAPDLVFIFRPSTGKVVWQKRGPWLRQHDPDFLEDGRISVFGNDFIDWQ